MKKGFMKKQYGLFLGLLCWANITLAAFPAFQVQDIRLKGVQHVEPGAVFRNFPISTGDVITQPALTAAVKSLYQSGYFENIEIEREGDVLILNISERPAVSKIRLKGNKAIKTENLLTGLESSGLKEGIVFKRSALQKIKDELQNLYSSQGRYNAKVDTEVVPVAGNRVAINIDIKEGSIAKINHINIVGNTVFDNEELTELFNSKLPSFWSWFSKDDRYSRERLSADIETLRSYYLDRGYINFKVTSTQVSISPDKKSVFISVNIDEGQQFVIGDISIKGELVVGEDSLRKVLMFNSGSVFSRSEVNKATESMKNVLGNSGYMFADIRTIPDPVSENTVDVSFFVTPGKRTYVRRINIKGNEQTADFVIRRQIQQMESALASSEKIKKSKETLDRTGFFATVDVATTPVPGTDDQIDVDLSVVEQASGNFTASVGFSQTESIIFGIGVSQNNFLGSGNRVSAEFTKSSSEQNVSFNYTNPFYTVDGVSRGFDVFYRDEDFEESSSSKFKINEFGGGVSFGYPIDEFQRLSFRLGLENVEVEPNDETSGEIETYIANNGDNFTNAIATIGWSENRLNRGVFPTAGYKQSLSLNVAVPGSDLSYYNINYSGSWIKSLSLDDRWLLGARGNLGYADTMGDKDFPFFKHFFAGGIGSMRGVSGNTLGPRDDQDDPIGGNVEITCGVDFIFPMIGLDDKTKYRTSLFVDFGGIYATECLAGGTTGDTRCNEGVNLSDLKYSAGIGFTWVTPLGPLTFSYAKLLNKEDGDEERTFDFSLGGTF